MTNYTYNIMLKFENYRLADLFYDRFILEFGLPKAREIVKKTTASKKATNYLSTLVLNFYRPTSKDIIRTINAIPYFLFSKDENLCMGALSFLIIWHRQFNMVSAILTDEEVANVIADIIRDCFSIRIRKNESMFSRFFTDIDKMGRHNVVDIINILLDNQKIVFDAVNKENIYFELSGANKQHVDEYIKYVCFIIAGAILTYKFNSLGYTEEGEPRRRVFKAVYDNSLNFGKKFIETNIIEFPFSDEFDEKPLLIITKAKLEEYTEDIKEYCETGKTSYVEEWGMDEEFGMEIHEVQFRFLQDLYEIKFEPTKGGISIGFHFKWEYYSDYNLEDKKKQTLNQIKKLINS